MRPMHGAGSHCCRLNEGFQKFADINLAITRKTREYSISEGRVEHTSLLDCSHMACGPVVAPEWTRGTQTK